MALRILFPKSTTVKHSDLPEFIISWELDEDGQYGYELQYMLKKDKVWSTCGIVESKTARSCTFERLYELCPVDFYEIKYRLVVYLEGPNLDIESKGEGVIHGTLVSDAYWVMFREQDVANLFVATNNSETTFLDSHPIYDEISPESKELAEVESINVNIGTESSPNNKILPLVQLDSPVASDLRVQTPTGIKSVMRFTADFRPTKVYSYGYIDQYVAVYEPVYETLYAKAYGTYSLYKTRTFYNFAEKYNDNPVFADDYNYQMYYANFLYYYTFDYYYFTYYTDYYQYTYYTTEKDSKDVLQNGEKDVLNYTYYTANYKTGSKPGTEKKCRPSGYGWYYDKTGRHEYVTSYEFYFDTITYDYVDSYTKHNVYKKVPYTYYTSEQYTYSESHGATGSVDKYNSTVYVPEGYKYKLGSYGYSEEHMYYEYYYYYTDYYYQTPTGKYYKYEDYYENYVYKYATYYAGLYEYYVTSYYNDLPYSYTYTA